jgi:hypothetical protein
MNTFLIRTVSDIEFLIGDLKARILPEEDFKNEIRLLAQNILNDAMAEDIDRDLEAGKKVMGHMRNPKTGQIEEVSKTEVICQKCGKHWLWGIDCEGKTFICPDCEKWLCGECGEVRKGDDRVEAGMKCYHCAYGY